MTMIIIITLSVHRVISVLRQQFDRVLISHHRFPGVQKAFPPLFWLCSYQQISTPIYEFVEESNNVVVWPVLLDI